MDYTKVYKSNRESTARISQIVQSLTETQLASVLPNGWTVSVTLAHLAFWDQRVIHVIELAQKEGKVTPSNLDESLNDILEPFLQAIPPATAAGMAVQNAALLDQLLENISDEFISQLESVNHRWVDRSLHRNAHLDDIAAFFQK